MVCLQKHVGSKLFRLLTLSGKRSNIVISALISPWLHKVIKNKQKKVDRKSIQDPRLGLSPMATWKCWWVISDFFPNWFLSTCAYSKSVSGHLSEANHSGILKEPMSILLSFGGGCLEGRLGGWVPESVGLTFAAHGADGSQWAAAGIWKLDTPVRTNASRRPGGFHFHSRVCWGSSAGWHVRKCRPWYRIVRYQGLRERILQRKNRDHGESWGIHGRRSIGWYK